MGAVIINLSLEAVTLLIFIFVYRVVLINALQKLSIITNCKANTGYYIEYINCGIYRHYSCFEQNLAYYSNIRHLKLNLLTPLSLSGIERYSLLYGLLQL